MLSPALTFEASCSARKAIVVVCMIDGGRVVVIRVYKQYLGLSA